MSTASNRDMHGSRERRAEIANAFTISAPRQVVWDFLLTSEAASCVPGAEITEIVDANRYRGRVRVRFGAVQLAYLVEVVVAAEKETKTLKIFARAAEQSGGGTAAATATAHLLDAPDAGARVELRLRLDVTGRVADFGAGIIQDVFTRLLSDFMQNLEQKLRERNLLSDSPSAVQPSPVNVTPFRPTDAAPRGTPRVLMESSPRGFELARYLRFELSRTVEADLWSESPFAVGAGALESLVAAIPTYDYAVLVLARDDLVTARDAVLFGLGACVGSLGNDRTFMVYCRDDGLNLPADLPRVTPVTYSRSGTPQSELRAVAMQLAQAMGVRYTAP